MPATWPCCESISKYLTGDKQEQGGEQQVDRALGTWRVHRKSATRVPRSEEGGGWEVGEEGILEGKKEESAVTQSLATIRGLWESHHTHGQHRDPLPCRACHSYLGFPLVSRKPSPPSANLSQISLDLPSSLALMPQSLQLLIPGTSDTKTLKSPTLPLGSGF